jgi:hypothetical protein
MATFSKNRVFGKLINQYEINGVSYSAETIGSITVGIAKYTANFTPPVAEQGRPYQAES